MLYPKKLNKGGTVGLVCASSPVSEEKADLCKKTVENMGYKVKAADNLSDNYGGYMAGTGKIRGEWLNKMFADPEVDAIFCIRGGDGSSRIMEFLDFDLIKNNPKIFVGYSDITNLHIAFNQQCDLVTFHGPMVSSNMLYKFDDETKRSFFKTINSDSDFDYENPADCDIKILKQGKAKGTIIGGNLSLLSASIGTPYEPDTEGKIIFIEEIDEPLTKIEKWGFHLRNSGKFKECAGVLLGQFTNVNNEYCTEYDYLMNFVDILDGYDIPVMYNLQSGHGLKNMTFPLGCMCEIDTAAKSIKFKVER